ncbi:MAG: hypothetical protein JJU25_06495 [Halomonas sp.]|nr:hypothetical protein [Halomonas sp.]MCC5882274.1 hypothetical protein [Halomonas sp.]
MPLASVFIDARSAGAKLPRHLVTVEQAASKWKGSHEVLLVDDTGDRRLPPLAHRHQARLLSTTSPLLGSRLNAAVAASQGERLLFPGTLTRDELVWLGESLSADERGLLCDAAVMRRKRRGRLQRWWSWLTRATTRDTFWVARDWFERIGGFDPQLDSEALSDLLERLRACGANVCYSGNAGAERKALCPPQGGHSRVGRE